MDVDVNILMMVDGLEKEEIRLSPLYIVDQWMLARSIRKGPHPTRGCMHICSVYIKATAGTIETNGKGKGCE